MFKTEYLQQRPMRHARNLGTWLWGWVVSKTQTMLTKSFEYQPERQPYNLQQYIDMTRLASSLVFLRQPSRPQTGDSNSSREVVCPTEYVRFRV
jgi:hypothetical protein